MREKNICVARVYYIVVFWNTVKRKIDHQWMRQQIFWPPSNQTTILGNNILLRTLKMRLKSYAYRQIHTLDNDVYVLQLLEYNRICFNMQNNERCQNFTDERKFSSEENTRYGPRRSKIRRIFFFYHRIRARNSTNNSELWRKFYLPRHPKFHPSNQRPNKKKWMFTH